jgi:hypothetical protein
MLILLLIYCHIQENFDKRNKKSTDNLPAQTLLPAKGCQKSSQIDWKIVPLRHFFPLKVVALIELLLYRYIQRFSPIYKAVSGGMEWGWGEWGGGGC